MCKNYLVLKKKCKLKKLKEMFACKPLLRSLFILKYKVEFLKSAKDLKVENNKHENDIGNDFCFKVTPNNMSDLMKSKQKSESELKKEHGDMTVEDKNDFGDAKCETQDAFENCNKLILKENQFCDNLRLTEGKQNFKCKYKTTIKNISFMTGNVQEIQNDNEENIKEEENEDLQKLSCEELMLCSNSLQYDETKSECKKCIKLCRNNVKFERMLKCLREKTKTKLRDNITTVLSIIKNWRLIDSEARKKTKRKIKKVYNKFGADKKLSESELLFYLSIKYIKDLKIELVKVLRGTSNTKNSKANHNLKTFLTKKVKISFIKLKKKLNKFFQKNMVIMDDNQNSRSKIGERFPYGEKHNTFNNGSSKRKRLRHTKSKKDKFYAQLENKPEYYKKKNCKTILKNVHDQDRNCNEKSLQKKRKQALIRADRNIPDYSTFEEIKKNIELKCKTKRKKMYKTEENVEDCNVGMILNTDVIDISEKTTDENCAEMNVNSFEEENEVDVNNEDIAHSVNECSSNSKRQKLAKKNKKFKNMQIKKLKNKKGKESNENSTVDLQECPTNPDIFDKIPNKRIKKIKRKKKEIYSVGDLKENVIDGKKAIKNEEEHESNGSVSNCESKLIPKVINMKKGKKISKKGIIRTPKELSNEFHEIQNNSITVQNGYKPQRKVKQKKTVDELKENLNEEKEILNNDRQYETNKIKQICERKVMKKKKIKNLPSKKVAKPKKKLSSNICEVQNFDEDRTMQSVYEQMPNINQQVGELNNGILQINPNSKEEQLSEILAMLSKKYLFNLQTNISNIISERLAEHKRIISRNNNNNLLNTTNFDQLEIDEIQVCSKKKKKNYFDSVIQFMEVTELTKLQKIINSILEENFMKVKQKMQINRRKFQTAEQTYCRKIKKISNMLPTLLKRDLLELRLCIDTSLKESGNKKKSTLEKIASERDPVVDNKINILKTLLANLSKKNLEKLKQNILQISDDTNKRTCPEKIATDRLNAPETNPNGCVDNCFEETDLSTTEANSTDHLKNISLKETVLNNRETFSDTLTNGCSKEMIQQKEYIVDIKLEPLDEREFLKSIVKMNDSSKTTNKCVSHSFTSAFFTDISEKELKPFHGKLEALEMERNIEFSSSDIATSDILGESELKKIEIDLLYRYELMASLGQWKASK